MEASNDAIFRRNKMSRKFEAEDILSVQLYGTQVGLCRWRRRLFERVEYVCGGVEVLEV